MTHKLNIADGLSLPVDAVTQTFAILAKRGVGKSYTASVMAEEMLKAGHTIIALDPTGAWWGLRSHYPVVIFGGEHADVPLEESAGEVVARSIVENRFPAVLDLSLFRKGQMIRFMVAFAETLYRLNRQAVHLFVDEADAFAPQARNYGGDENRMLGAMEDIVRRGRKRGIGCTLITQRPAVLNKNVLTQCEVLVALRLVHPKDIDAIEEWVNVHADPDTAKEMIDSLPSLAVGEAWFWSPGWADLFKRVKVRARETFDSGATPKAGEAPKRPKHLTEIDLNALGDQIKATVEKAKADDPRELRKRIAELERKLRERPAETVEVEKIVKVPVLENGQLDRTERVIGRLEAVGAKLSEASTAAVAEAAELKRLILPAFAPVAGPVAARPNVASAPRPVSAPRKPAPEPPADGEFRPNRTQQRILDALAWYESLGNPSPSLTQVGAVALIDPTGGHFSNNVGPLSSGGLIVRGDGVLSLTDAGRALANQPESVGTLAEYHDVLRRRVRRMKSAGGKTIEILDTVIAGGGESLTTEQIGQAVGVDHTGGHFSNSIGPLGTAGLIVRRSGLVTPTDVLFPPGLVG
jgi:uncharacterized protein